MLSTGHGRKTDVHDATAVALVAKHRRLRPVQAEDLSNVIRLVSDHCDVRQEAPTEDAATW